MPKRFVRRPRVFPGPPGPTGGGVGPAGPTGATGPTGPAGTFPARLTTAQRDALALSEGLFIFNTDTDRFEGYQGAQWVVIVTRVP